VVALRIRAQARAEIAEAFDWYLARSQDASADFLTELDVALNKIGEAPEHFPVVRGRLRRVLLHGHGGKKSEVDNDTKRFFRAVDRAVLEHHSQPSSLPLILAALPEHQHTFHAVSHNPFLLPENIDIHPDAVASIDDLRQRAWKVLQPQYEARLSALAEEFGSARARKMGDDVLPQVARAAVAGRVKTLLIEAQRYIPGRLDVETGRVDIGGELNDGHTDDLLDDLGELVTSLGGKVVVVPGERMPTTTGLAAIYRFGPSRPESAPASDTASLASTETATPPRATTASAAAATPVAQTLEDHTVVQLYEMAREEKIRGRSNMRKAELIAAIRASRS
jgi:hypothetical protein